jgi:uncharacterized protein
MNGMENFMYEKSRLLKALFVLAVVVAVYFSVKIITEVKSYQFIGGGTPASNIISFEGKGEVSAVPDLATVSFTLRASEREVKSAQDKVTAKESRILDFLESQGVEKKDIKTENYSSYPKYDYGVPCYGGSGVPCRPSEPKIIGYEVSENVSVKVRDITKAGTIIQGLGSLGADQINGPNFSIENEDDLKAEARRLAIEDAKAKAEVLARDLGVHLVRIVNFSESGNYPGPYYAKGMSAMDSFESAVAPAPELPTGENKIISNVSITYEIR